MGCTSCTENTTPCQEQACGCKFEVDAGCVRYTSDALTCIDVTTGDLLEDILKNINAKFCDLTHGNYIEVVAETAGANCANGGVKLLVKDINDGAILATEYLCNGADGADGIIPGGGTLNYLAKWTPNGSELGDSLIQDDDSNVSIGATPLTNYLFRVVSSTDTYAISGENEAPLGGAGVFGKSTTVSTGTNIGTDGTSSGSSVMNIGARGLAQGVSAGTNIGGVFKAGNGSANYAVQLYDPSAAMGLFLKSMTNDGKANWAQITKDDITDGISGTGGSLNYLPKWTPDGTTLGDSAILDETSILGGHVSINGKGVDFQDAFYVKTKLNEGSIAIVGESVRNFSGISKGVYGKAIVAGNGTTGGCWGVWGQAYNNLKTNLGVRGEAGKIGETLVPEAIGGHFSAVNATVKHSVQLQDGTEFADRFLKCVDGTGKANWAEIPDSRPYVSYSVIISQSGLAAPTVTILENTLSEVPTLSYDSVGNYSINTVGAVFTSNKTFIMCNQNNLHQDYRTVAKYGSTTAVQLKSTVGTVATDNIFSICSLEIRVYS